MVRKKRGNEEKVTLEIQLSRYLFSRLTDFCRDQKIEASTVVERALEEYFHMGDIGH